MNKDNEQDQVKNASEQSAQDCQHDPKTCLENSRFNVKTNDSPMDDCMGRSLDQLSQAFMASARRWEMIVYPALFAFILLAGYGFFLIYSLTTDISRVADDMDKITRTMEKVSLNMDLVAKNMVVMTQTVDQQSASLTDMSYQIRGMNASMNQIRYDMSIMNNSVSRPMSFMNSFMPW